MLNNPYNFSPIFGGTLLRHLLSVFFPILAALLLFSCSTQKPLPEEKTHLPPSGPEYTSDRPFEIDTLYSLLVAEMAGDRHRFDIMLNNYTQQAEETRDVGVIARAARLARYLKSHPTGLEMSLLWTEIAPQSTEAHYIAAAELIHANRLLDAIPHSRILIKNQETAGFDAIGARAQQGGDIMVTKRLITEFDQLIQQYPKHQPLHIGISLLYQHAGNLEKALSHTEKAISIMPDDFQARAQETSILQKLGRSNEALDKLKQLVESNPKNHQLRLQYARQLLKTDLASAQKQFEVLLESSPESPELSLTLALIKYERGLLDEAKSLFLDLSDNPAHGSTAHFYLGKIEITHKNSDSAIFHFSQVQDGANYLPAISQLCEIFISQGQSDKAIAFVKDIRAHTAADQAQQLEGLYLLESHVLSSQGQYLEAIAQLRKGITRYPESSKLIYNRAMLFTRIDEISNAEKDLKRVLSLKPDHAAALNALGYTLADRTDRLEEAYDYIQRAYLLTPDDPAVMDSLGWIEFRRGNYTLALKNLRKAMEAMPDHEIAAHLGEVLWVMGNTTEATKVWRNGLELNPESAIIKHTMQRLQAQTTE